MARDDPKFIVRMPPDAKAFIAAQAARNGSSQNSEIIRCIRDRMERASFSDARIATGDDNGSEERVATTGNEIGVMAPVEAGNSTHQEMNDAAHT